jgi:SPX domain protein involved in polyphosphate accumulation
MGFASYFENIVERFNDTQRYFQNEISGLRKRLEDSDLVDRERVASDISAFKQRLSRFLDELDARSTKLFDEAKDRLGDRQVNLVAYMKKRDGQLADARRERDELKRKFERTRELNTNLLLNAMLLQKNVRRFEKETSYWKLRAKRTNAAHKIGVSGLLQRVTSNVAENSTSEVKWAAARPTIAGCFPSCVSLDERRV